MAAQPGGMSDNDKMIGFQLFQVKAPLLRLKAKVYTFGLLSPRLSGKIPLLVQG